ncbi:DUF58 domain-containing protein [Actinophytocola oryzae]|uniref:Uncharacterized protein (DUF58 family) n=1 Tax=Actinophytocola oryzae TaxID=502181 RepID=A0A4R7V985_9PSEU|nr:DUF58 domain-containing protein [Actinophytocola oryzae]TDV45475.1 uncharacterized protein (DUF58 family) [Actinophytocola oryzae]
MTERRESRAHAWFAGRRAAREQGWRRTDALVRATVCGLGLVAVGLVLHRLELVLIGMPLVVGLLLSRPPTGTPTVTSEPRHEAVDAGKDSTVAVTVDPGEGAAFAALRMPMPNMPGAGKVHLLPAVAGEVHTRLSWRLWGHGIYLRPDYLFASHEGLYMYGPVVGVVAHHTVLPPIDPLPPGPLPPRAAGLVGAHRSARPGDGMELRDIRPFRSGDRLRRVDWRVSLRAAAARGGELAPGTLHVRERHAEADADLVLALDTRLDVDGAVADWNARLPGSGVRPGGSLDLGVRATSSLAAAFLRHGDRVGLVDLGHPRSGVPIGSGRRHLERIRHQLVYAAQRVAGSGDPVLNPAQIPAGATVLVLSPFLDDKLVDVVVRVARRGRLVVAVDLLPDDLTPDASTPWGAAVVSVLRAEHRVRIRAMEEHGVAVVRWQSGPPLGAMLRSARRRRRS